jgi:hypothetical protein
MLNKQRDPILELRRMIEDYDSESYGYVVGKDLPLDEVIKNVESSPNPVVTDPKRPNFILPDGRYLGDTSLYWHHPLMQKMGIFPPGFGYMDGLVWLLEHGWIRVADATSFHAYDLEDSSVVSRINKFLSDASITSASQHFYLEDQLRQRSYFITYGDFLKNNFSIRGLATREKMVGAAFFS